MTLSKLVAGNWKMHGVSSDLDELRAISAAAGDYPGVDVALCVPAVLIERAVRAAPGFAIGAQDVHHAEKGAHTGNVSAHMLLDAGATLTIVGHSERRDAQRERNEEVRAKAKAALASGLGVILCVGESLEQREAGRALDCVTTQLAASLPETPERPGSLAVAYEPIWAIGTGRVASCDDIKEMHGALRRCLVDRFGPAGSGVRILYGGSVKPSNAAEIFRTPDVDGALVGGASLKAADFVPIIAAAAQG
ncbi:triose-phosphate isomerase [Sphingomonas sp.]|uniref:triose-phosphate isomerase n=1 Tax=Sphingomonas sp. TaxID=28214 RepID=UPI0025DBD461|nr:triose-phosphate isomerase [Sphingomonas sp.]MBV9527688.1 triose-phosphate isomerase [Sphingomonas sp.]